MQKNIRAGKSNACELVKLSQIIVVPSCCFLPEMFQPMQLWLLGPVHSTAPPRHV